MTEFLVVLAVMLIYSLFLMIDRVLLMRGGVHITGCKLHDKQNGYWRFALSYKVFDDPFWGEIKYSLKDLNNPATVIVGKSRNLDHVTNHINHEFLHIKEALTKTTGEHNWQMHVTVTTVVGHFNPLYKYFPMTVTRSFEVNLNE